MSDENACTCSDAPKFGTVCRPGGIVTVRHTG